MSEKIILLNQISQYREYLIEAEKSAATLEKYIRDVRAFFVFLDGKPLTKEMAIRYKNNLIEQNYAIKSINSMLVSINRFFDYIGCGECKVKSLKSQRQIYLKEEKELTKQEYLRLLEAAKTNTRLNLILQTICGTGIRVSELKYFTVEAMEEGEVVVKCKGKARIILIPGKLRKILKWYCKKNKIQTGIIFRTKSGKAINRSNIWTAMKKICKKAGVNPSKVFPHNLRKLFARTFYKIEHDIAKLADILGHGSIETTRIYIMSTGTEHRRKIEQMDLVIEYNHKKILHN